MRPETLEKLQSKAYEFPKEIQFINTILNKGVPVKNIEVNDWSACPSPRIYITRPFTPSGDKYKGGDWKRFQRFGPDAVKRALKFWYA